MTRLLAALLLLAACRDPLVLTNVTVVDVVSGARHPDMTVVIEGERIVEVRRGRAANAIDAGGKFLIPGLWDMHAHLWNPARELPMMIANGVLGARDLGSHPDRIFLLRNDEHAPRIVACGPIVDGPAPTNPAMSIAVGNAAEGRAAVRSLKEMGADCVKVHDGVPRDAYFAIADEAKKAGLPLVGHIPVAVPTPAAAHAGQRSIEHQIGLRGCSLAEAEVMEFEASHDVMAEAMRTRNFSLIPETIASKGTKILDRFDGKRAAALYRAFAASGTFVDPTLVTQHALTYIDELAQGGDPRLAYIPAATRASWLPQNGMLTRYRTPSYIDYRRRELAKTLEQIPVARRAGVMFLAGTDMSIPYVYPGFSLHDELALFVQAGLTPLEALQTATINAARCMRIEEESGSIAPGRRADLVLLDADPLIDIANTKKIHAVILRGKLLDRRALDEMLAAARRAAAD